MQKPSISYWIITTILTLWNAFGMYAVFGDPYLLGYGAIEPDQLKMLEARPAWALAGSVTAVVAGVLAGLMMLARRKIARTFFVTSLIGLILQDIWFFGNETARTALPSGFAGLQAAIVVSILVGLWTCQRAIAKGSMR
ncbi:MAG: hypothetical protein AAFX04_04880 [Pseudomonadota bacterium]